MNLKRYYMYGHEITLLGENVNEDQNCWKYFNKRAQIMRSNI